MIPNLNTIWRYIGPGNGNGDIQRVIFSDKDEVVTISERSLIYQIEWSGLFLTSEFPKLFVFIK